MEPYLPTERLREIAYYYPEPVWEIGERESNWIKNLLLLFDGIGLLIPPEIHDKLFRRDPHMAHGLLDYDLLHLFDPKELVDTSATQALADTLNPLIDSGVFDPLSNSDHFDFISYSRLGYFADESIFTLIYQKLRERGLADESTDGGFSFPIEATVRSLILVLWAQFLRDPGKQMGFDFHPTTSNREVHRVLKEFLSIPSLPSAGHVVTLDLQTIGVDLTNVALDDVLSFKEDHGQLYRAYRRSVHELLRTMRLLDSPEESQRMMADRKEQLEDLAQQINVAAASAWKHGVKDFAVGVVGTYAPVEPVKNLMQALGDGRGQAINAASSIFTDGQAFSYLFQAQRRFGSATTDS